MSAQAAVFYSPGEPLRLQRFPLPDLGANEALVKVRCATICGSDLHTVFGRRKSEAPAILGHEMVGEIEEIGEGGVLDFSGKPLQRGARITWSMVWSCRRCFYCQLGLTAKCEKVFKFGHQRLGTGRDLSGGYAQYCHLPAGTAIYRVPENVPDPVAASSNCATATVAAVVRTAGILAGKSIAVVGSGMLGLTAVAMAKAYRAAQVIAVDPDSKRRALAPAFGATSVVAAGVEAAKVVKDMAGGRGVDLVFEFSGVPDACQDGLQMLRPGGHLVMAGAVFPAPPMSISAEQIVRQMVRISGVYNYQPKDLATAQEFLRQHASQFPFASMIAKSFSLQECNAAFAYAETEKPLRTAILPD